MTYDELKAEFYRRGHQLKPLKKYDSAEISRQLSQILADIVSENIFEIENVQEACEKILKELYDHVNEVNASLQREIDKKTGLQIAPQKADFPTERVQQLARSLEDSTVPPETIQRRARNAVENVGNSFHDDYVRKNAEFRSKAGVKCYIVRETSGKCCPWCASLGGRYLYGNEPADVYRRHDNCTCTVTFENGRERQDVWSKEKWLVSPVLKIPYKPIVMDRTRAETLQKNQLAQYQGLDKSARNDIIELRDQEGFTRFEITDDVIKNIPLVVPQGFSEEDAVALQSAHKMLLEEARKYPVGTECSMLLDLDMEPIDNIRIGEVDGTKIPHCTDYHIALHNHSSGETFSAGDIKAFAESETMQMLTAIGNNGKIYTLSKTTSFNSEKFANYLNEMLNKPIFKDKTYIQLKKDYVSTLTDAEKEELKKILIEFSEDLIKGAELHGAVYAT